MTKKQAEGLSSKAIKLCLALSAVFILEELLLPVSIVSVNSYHMSVLDYRLLSIVVNLPIIIVWFVAFWGYSRLAGFARVVKGTPESSGYRSLERGLTWLAWALPITSIIDRFLAGLSNNKASLHSTTTIISNYFNLSVPLIAFIIISVAAKTLISSQQGTVSQPKSRVVMVAFLSLGALYCYLILKAAHFSGLSSSNNLYFLPIWLLIISVVVPYLYSWFLGLLAAYSLSLFSLNMSGLLYKRSLLYLTSGLVAIILSFIVSQYLSAVWPAKPHLIFNYHLVVTVIFRIIGGLGFVSMAIGANKLKMIEEV